MPAFPLFSLGNLQAWPSRRHLSKFNSVPIAKQLALTGYIRSYFVFSFIFLKSGIYYVLCLVGNLQFTVEVLVDNDIDKLTFLHNTVWYHLVLLYSVSFAIMIIQFQ